MIGSNIPKPFNRAGDRSRFQASHLMKNLIDDKLTIALEPQGDEIRVCWRGVSDSRQPARVLEPYLVNLMHELGKYHKCVFDFTELEFMNSSTVGPLLHFINRVKGTSVNLVLCYSEQKEWQDVSFRAMRVLTNRMGNVSVEKK